MDEIKVKKRDWVKNAAIIFLAVMLALTFFSNTIMNQGVIQQVGTPQEVFDHPSNMFVAGFIGTPQMNFIDCVLTIRDGAVWAKAGDNFVALPHFAAFDGGAEEGRRVVLGIRPEYVTVGGKEGLPAVVTLKELTGSSVQLHLKLGEGEIIVVVPVTMDTK